MNFVSGSEVLKEEVTQVIENLTWVSFENSFNSTNDLSAFCKLPCVTRVTLRITRVNSIWEAMHSWFICTCSSLTSCLPSLEWKMIHLSGLQFNPQTMREWLAKVSQVACHHLSEIQPTFKKWASNLQNLSEWSPALEWSFIHSSDMSLSLEGPYAQPRFEWCTLKH